MVLGARRSQTVTNRYEKRITVSIEVKANIFNGLFSYPQARRESYTMIHIKDLHQTVIPFGLGVYAIIFSKVCSTRFVPQKKSLAHA
jgi:hypothetical protein